jgi:hypothetical protein
MLQRTTTVFLSEPWPRAGEPEAAAFAESVAVEIRAFAATVESVADAFVPAVAFWFAHFSAATTVDGPVPVAAAASVVPGPAESSTSAAASDTSGPA